MCLSPSGLWLKRREELGNPLGQAQLLPPVAPGAPEGPLPDQAADFVMEIGCEELPPQEAAAAVAQLRHAWRSSSIPTACWVHALAQQAHPVRAGNNCPCAHSLFACSLRRPASCMPLSHTLRGHQWLRVAAESWLQ